MKRSTPLVRTGPLARARSPRTRKMRRPTMPSGLRHEVYLRAGGRCDLCTAPLPGDQWEAHHRRLRSRGGADTHENLIALCATCHHDRVHANPAWATEHGYMVPSWGDPATTPILRHGTTWQQPTGRTWTAATPITEGAPTP